MAPRSQPNFWATLPPHRWARARARAQVVARYLELPAPTQEIAERYAAELGINVRTFYRLVASYKAAKTALGKPSRQGLSRPLQSSTAAVLDAVIGKLGPAASDSQIHAECRAGCATLGFKAPSLNAVRTRTGKRRATKHLAERLHLSADLICDSSPLLLDIDDRGTSQPARLTGLIDVASGTVLAHRIHSGAAPAKLLIDLANAALEGDLHTAKTNPSSRSLVVTTQLMKAAIEAETTLASLGVILIAPGKPVRSGAALIAVLGRRIGRIPFAPLRRIGTVAPALPIGEAQQVIEYLLAHPDT